MKSDERVVLFSEPHTFLGRSACNLFHEKGFEVRGIDAEGTPGGHLPFLRRASSEKVKDELLGADIVVLELKEGGEDPTEFARKCVRLMSTAHYMETKVVVLISSVQSWARTTEKRTAKAMEAAAKERRQVVAEALEAGEEPPAEEPLEELESIDEGWFKSREGRRGRCAHPAYESWKELEELTKEVHSKNLWTYTIFSGLTYGCGENKMSHIFQRGWELNPRGLPVFGEKKGSNNLPMIHVKDLSQMVFKLGNLPEAHEERYFFGADSGGHTWSDVMGCVSANIGDGKKEFLEVPNEALASWQYVQHFMVDLKLNSDSLLINEVLDGDDWVCQSGFVENAKAVFSEFIQTRGLHPLRMILRGPPASGTTFLGQRLSKEYRVPHLKAADVIREFESQAAELQAEIAELKRLQREDDQPDDEDEEENDEPEAVLGPEDEQEAEGPEEEAEAERLAALEEKLQFVTRTIAMRRAPRQAGAKKPVEEEEDEDEGEEGAFRPRKKGPFLRNKLTTKPQPPPPPPPPAEKRYNQKGLAIIYRWKLRQPCCRNQGYIMDSYPKTKAQAKLLFEDQDGELEPPEPVEEEEGAEEEEEEEEDAGAEGEEGEAGQGLPELFPSYVFDFQASDQFLLERFLKLPSSKSFGNKYSQGVGHNSPENFIRRLNAYKDNSSKHTGLLDYLASLLATPLTEGAAPKETQVLQITADRSPLLPLPENWEDPLWEYSDPAYDEIVGFLGSPNERAFDPMPQYILRQAAKGRRLAEIEREKEIEETVKREAAEREASEALRAWEEADAGRVVAVTAEREKYSYIETQGTKKYLMENVIPSLTRSMAEVSTLRPEDPIDFLADRLLAYSTEKDDF